VAFDQNVYLRARAESILASVDGAEASLLRMIALKLTEDSSCKSPSLPQHDLFASTVQSDTAANLGLKNNLEKIVVPQSTEPFAKVDSDSF
jgi:hypothetical protein